MSIFYSAAQNGFYDDSVHALLPSDAVEISQKLHQDLLDGQAAGKIIAVGAGGVPFSCDPAAPSEAEKLEQAKNEAMQFLGDTDFYFTVDKYATLSVERQVELAEARAEARRVVNQQ